MLKYLVLTAAVVLFIAGSLATLSIIGQVAVNSHSMQSDIMDR